ncbi:facilitated trehalose transporter Tret1-like [Ctenocephalides felis]|uniref:facilitated trehalose transporter Tret1-like n=2 Tax=Ctenocephalides felis TaxID=7515 RepID=UPI000E6E3F62|nr:facilitated trehalose transporter Tret1-like [Ctenocephalides felis]
MHFNNIIKNGRYTQFVAANAVNILTISAGASMAWTSPVLAKLAKDKSYSPFPRHITSPEAMWMGALVSLGTAVGPFICAFSTNKIGMKQTLLWSALPSLVGWILTASATTIMQLLVARFILGIACSVVFSVAPSYVSEIADNTFRGTLGALLQLTLTIGMLLVYCIGPYTSYVVFTTICGIIPIIFAICFIPMPDSPYCCASKGKLDKAKASLVRLRDRSADEIDKEVKQIQADVEAAKDGSYRELLCSGTQKLPLFLGIGLAVFFQLSGVTAVLIYAESLFEQTASSLSPDVMAMIMGAIQTFAALITPFIFDRCGRKSLLIFSGAGMTIAMGTFGAYFYIIENNLMNADSLTSIPMGCIAAFIFTNSIGFGGAIWVVISEIFPGHLRAHASAICTSICFVTAFVIALTFDDLQALLKNSGTFGLYAFFCALSVIFVAVFLPETRGLSFEEIQKKLKTKFKSNVVDVGHDNPAMERH